jgi:hypothetical protein
MNRASEVEGDAVDDRRLLHRALLVLALPLPDF